MAAPQVISLGIGSPASIGWFITFGLGDLGGAVEEAATAGNVGTGVLPITFQAPAIHHMPAPFMQELRGGLHHVLPIEETP